VLATAANPNGLIGASGRIGQKHQIAALMDSLAPHYGDDYCCCAAIGTGATKV
jgi:hypothetical protein